MTYDLTVADTVTAAQSGSDLRNEAALSNAAARDGGTDRTTVDRVDSAQAATAPFQAVKSIVATSESHTGLAAGSERVTVGEIVRYRLVVEVPEGTHAVFELRDLLPDGLTYLEDGTSTVAFVSDGQGSGGGLTSSGTNGLGNAAQVAGSEANLAFVTPTHVLADAAITEADASPDDTWNSGTDPVFALGDLQKPRLGREQGVRGRRVQRVGRELRRHEPEQHEGRRVPGADRRGPDAHGQLGVRPHRRAAGRAVEVGWTTPTPTRATPSRSR